MQNQKVVKRTKLAASLFLLAAICSYSPWRQSGASAAQTGPRRQFEIVGVSVPMSERTGADDGASAVIHFGGDTHGSLEPCG